MEENLEPNENGHNRQPASFGVNRWLMVAAVALIAAAGLAFGYGYRQQIAVGHMTAQASVANATINEMQGQLNTLTAKLNEMSAAQQAAEAAQKKTPAVHANAAGAKLAAGKKSTTENKRLKELQARIDEQQKQLKETQDQVEKNRVHESVSAPKYKPSEVAASSTGAATVTPVAAHPQPPDQVPQSPKQPEQ